MASGVAMKVGSDALEKETGALKTMGHAALEMASGVAMKVGSDVVAKETGPLKTGSGALEERNAD